MSEPLDLFRASRDDLVALVLAQRDQLADQARRLAWQAEEVATLRQAVADLTTRVGELVAERDAAGAAAVDVPGAPSGMPGLKPGPAPTRAAKERRKRAHGYGRRRMTPTAQQVHALDACPRCHGPLSGGTVVRTREVIDVPLAPAVVTEHVYLVRRCPRCGGTWQPGPGLAGVVVGPGRLGIGLLSLIAWLWAEGRLPFAVIQDYLAKVHGLPLSQGALVGAVRTVAERGKALVEEQLAAIRGSPVVHADETGWREDGVNGYLWTLSTPAACYFTHGRRERAVLEEALGAGFEGVLVSDFYVAYTTLEGVRHQYCWAHLLRDVDDLVRQHPRAAGVRGWADTVHRLFARARAEASPDPLARRRARQRYEAELSTLIAPYLAVAAPTAAAGPEAVGPEAVGPEAVGPEAVGPEAVGPEAVGPEAVGPEAPPAALCRRMEKHLGELFLFVEDPAVPPTNNAAERSLRHLVTSRKISGGTRSAAGTTTRVRLATLFGTWRLQGLDPLAQCRQLLAAPQV
jgi:hypothetical protein